MEMLIAKMYAGQKPVYQEVKRFRGSECVWNSTTLQFFIAVET